MDKLTEHFK
jgi:dynein heavy chain, axonemal